MTAKTDIYDIGKHLWDSADELRANSGLKESEYAVPVLGLIFLKYADSRFSQAESALAGTGSGRRKVSKADYQAQGVMYLPPGHNSGDLFQFWTVILHRLERPPSNTGVDEDGDCQVLRKKAIDWR